MEVTASVRDRQTESERKKEKGKSIQNMTAKMAGKDEPYLIYQPYWKMGHLAL
jgi:hypothetical protein